MTEDAEYTIPGIGPGCGGDAMKTITAGMAAGAATLALIGAATASADPTPTPSPDYTWECDTDVYGHTSCHAEQIPTCVVSQDGQWVVEIPAGSKLGDPGYTGIPAPCNAFGPGGVTNLVNAPYPARPPYWPPQPVSVPSQVVLPPGYRDGD
jgi:hypothetical protein